MKLSNFDRWLTTEPEPIEIEWHEDSSKENEDDFDQLYCDGDDCFVAIGNYMGYGEDRYGRDVEHYAMRIYGVVNGKRYCEDCLDDMQSESPEIANAPEPCEKCDWVGCHGPGCPLAKESLDREFTVR
jgi:hypothetical protein